ncbi:hypothetical protein A8C56_20370 [Niabella ginsenosidivorans]|uniref:Major facilitator superfamily (MFS) profile domain-containing protein n=1 Tax=Niabella ginsenosidivorans TaxID=1176587 RepID=A0A1A9I6R4_9BACT|nr:MFS transporter [Niabella ginsenosidivorans]ANH83025.1 hypothetical protein A8C56_20370 [Niabella ginsenosidivorans]
MINKQLLFSAACAGMLFFGVCLITLGSVVPDLKVTYGLNDLEAGALFSILPFGVLAGSLIFGPVCDRYGYKFLLSIACICMAIGLEGIAFAPTLLVLNSCVFLFGAGGGAINGATNALVADISHTNKGANLSLLGVFFGIGALGMPFILGLLQHHFNYTVICAVAGITCFLLGICYALLTFPEPKQQPNGTGTKSSFLLKESFLWLISFFLFFQSSFEAIINNWTTSYLSSRFKFEKETSLFALSLFVTGMAVMRLLLGSFFRTAKKVHLFPLLFGLVASGLLFLTFGNSFFTAASGLILTGAGLAGGFPFMLGYLGSRYAAASGTAFSIALTIALTGNILINSITGIIIQYYGIRHLTTIACTELAFMIFLYFFIIKQLKS